MVADVLALFFSNLRKLIYAPLAFGIIKNIKSYSVSFAARLVHDTVFLFCPHLNACIMLRNPPQYICALTDINNFFVYLDTVNSCVFILFCKSVVFHPMISIFFIVCH